MYQIIIVLRDNNSNLLLSFSDYNNAILIRDLLSKELIAPELRAISLEDDYGHFYTPVVADIVAIAFADLKKELDANEEKSLLQARAQKRLQERVSSDAIMNMRSTTGLRQ